LPFFSVAYLLRVFTTNFGLGALDGQAVGVLAVDVLAFIADIRLVKSSKSFFDRLLVSLPLVQSNFCAKYVGVAVGGAVCKGVRSLGQGQRGEPKEITYQYGCWRKSWHLGWRRVCVK
jgi:hypothetical protein